MAGSPSWGQYDWKVRFLSVLALLLAAMGAFALVVLRQPALTPAAPAAQAPASTTLPAANRTPLGAGDVTFEVDEATLTRQANASFAGQSLGDTPLGPATVRSITVQLRNGAITAGGSAQVGPASLPIAITASLAVDAGRVRVNVTSARVGGFPVPSAAWQELQAALQSQVDVLLGVQPIRVRSVEVGDGKIVVSGTRA